jgi:hypothetical protein
VPGHPIPDTRLEPGLGHAGLPEIERRAQPLTLIGAQSLASQTQFLAPLGGALSTLDPVACLPLTLAPLLCFPALTILGLLLLSVGAFALRGASSLGIAFTLCIATLLGAPSLDGTAPLSLRGTAPLPLSIAFTVCVASLFRRS